MSDELTVVQLLQAEVLLLRHAHQKMHRRAQRAEMLYRRQSWIVSQRRDDALVRSLRHTVDQNHNLTEHLRCTLSDAELARDDAREWAIFMMAFVDSDAFDGIDTPDWLPPRTPRHG